jgi:N6-L-threonylcarbamoyladenine synthase
MSALVRDMTAGDLAQVAAIEVSAFELPWAQATFERELWSPARAYVVAEQLGQVVGYAGVMVVDGDAHVMNLAVERQSRRQGLGRQLLGAALERASRLGASRVTLEVRPSNTAAIELYVWFGMTAVGERPGYYRGSGEAALIMWGELQPVAGAAAPAGGADRPALRRGTRTVSPHDEGQELILAIETSCDETAAAVMQGGKKLLANVVASQIDFHARFGGVVPEIASRKHTEAIVAVVDEALEEAASTLGIEKFGFDDLDALAVTHGPGLIGALVVGLAYAKGVSFATGLPLVGVNHLEGHIFANVFADPEVRPPLVALVVSGGHTSLVHMPQWGVYHTLGETLDDATGEAFDKVAKVLGLGYPGGPVLSRLAEQGDPKAIEFPRAMMHSGDFAFSLSGLKTAVINHIRHEREAGREIDVPDLAASFQQAIIDVQVSKAVRAVKETAATSFCLAGGVAANPALRRALTAAIEPLGVHVSVPPLHLCTDNAAMIAAAAHYRYLRGDVLGLDAEPLASMRLDTE